MASINKVILIGHLGANPEVREITNGLVAVMSLATSRKTKNANGEYNEETEWHRVVVFGKTAEIADQYLAKGSQVYVEGRLRTRKYTDKNGVEKSVTEIIGENLTMLGSRNQAQGETAQGQSHGYTQPQARPAKPAPSPYENIPF